MHRYAFSNWVPLNLQLLQLSVSESEFAFARIAAEVKFVYVTALVHPLTLAYPQKRFAALAARGVGFSFQLSSAPNVERVGLQRNKAAVLEFEP